MALSGKSTDDPVITGRKAAKLLKAGANHVMVNVRELRAELPVSNVTADERVKLLKKLLPSDGPLPGPPVASMDFENWIHDNILDHDDKMLISASDLRW